ncbi:hypothetical protein BJ085DRAFT_16116 [Dimargaris cristalligena]|uniref:GATOR2 complex protein MIO zinc-ribbon like domain-containing protein n=1 Tax=Dimargaris cristalligena TaxID=215637 RepID=A0A4P9ZTN9_9FUNG|nr:hypothetical protein BJ085DRAFT_16116 [Dimargaris cristalligena]|eukprot:RKP36893.1 hypothetical protein BJ085DRAFT_16116 [Dimargaris cristalligena]
MELIDNYANRTADTQTAALIMSFSPIQATPNSVKKRCIECYRDLLDQWQMFETRAVFDIERGKWMRRYQIPVTVTSQPPILVRCTFCMSSLMQSLNLVGGAGVPSTNLDRDGNRRFQHMNSNRFDNSSMQCPNCKAALPSCPICLLSLGTPANICMASSYLARNGNNPFDWWFMWCQTCRHGGHQKHLTEWFMTHNVCPVADCLCHCREMD